MRFATYIILVLCSVNAHALDCPNNQPIEYCLYEGTYVSCKTDKVEAVKTFFDYQYGSLYTLNEETSLYHVVFKEIIADPADTTGLRYYAKYEVKSRVCTIEDACPWSDYEPYEDLYSLQENCKEACETGLRYENHDVALENGEAPATTCIDGCEADYVTGQTPDETLMYKANPTSCPCLGSTSVSSDSKTTLKSQLESSCQIYYENLGYTTFTGMTFFDETDSLLTYEANSSTAGEELPNLTCNVNKVMEAPEGTLYDYELTGEFCGTTGGGGETGGGDGGGETGGGTGSGGSGTTYNFDTSGIETRLDTVIEKHTLLAEKIAEQTTAITDKQEATKTAITEKLDTVNTTLTEKFTLLNTSITNQTDSTNTKLDTIAGNIETLGGKLDNANSTIDSGNESLSTIATGIGTSITKLDGLGEKTDTTNNTLADIKDALTLTTPTGEQPEFTDTEEALNAKKTEFAQSLTNRKAEVMALLDISDISFSGELPDMTLSILDTSFTIDTEWVNYILTFMGVLMVFMGYWHALAILLGG